MMKVGVSSKTSGGIREIGGSGATWEDAVDVKVVEKVRPGLLGAGVEEEEVEAESWTLRSISEVEVLGVSCDDRSDGDGDVVLREHQLELDVLAKRARDLGEDRQAVGGDVYGLGLLSTPCYPSRSPEGRP